MRQLTIRVIFGQQVSFQFLDFGTQGGNVGAQSPV